MEKKETKTTAKKSVKKSPTKKSAKSAPKKTPAKGEGGNRESVKEKTKQRAATDQAINSRVEEDKQTFLSVFEKKAANVSAAAAACNITRRTFYYWKENDPEFAEKVKEIEDSLLDFAESKLLEKVQEGDLTAIIFTLKTKGKDRGYVERVENNVTGNMFMDMMKGLPDDPPPTE